MQNPQNTPNTPNTPNHGENNQVAPNDGSTPTQSGNGASGIISNFRLEKLVTVVSLIIGVFGIIGTIFTACTLIILPSNKNIYEIENVKTQINAQSESIADVKNKVRELDNTLDEITEDVIRSNALISTKIGDIVAYPVDMDKDARPRLILTNNEKFLEEPKLTSGNRKAATGLKDRNVVYSTEDLQNRLIITTYEQDGNEVYFLGSFNEKNHWNGDCVLNIYRNHELITIFSGLYDDGELNSYKRVSCDDGEWTVTDRTIRKDDLGNKYNKGETWVYKKSKPFNQEINAENIDKSLILTVDSFRDKINEKLVSYYNGRTSDGFYNDDTGEAFLVIYFDDGEILETEGKDVIRTLYEGKFTDGYFKDESDESWYIVRKPETTYMYYEGSFSNKTADHKKVKEEENPIGREYINKKLREKGFERYESEFYIEYE